MDGSARAESPDVSVVVPTHDRRDRLAALIESLRAQTLSPERFEIVVVDDGSADETPALLERLATENGPGELRTVRRDDSRGPAAARNAGWREARGPLIAFTDDDCEADPGWLESLLAVERDEGVVVQGRTEPIPREADRISPFTRTLAVTERGSFFPTCNIAYPRTLLERLDGFDESYPAPGGEDTDLALRALEAGARIEFADDARVFHAVNEYGPLGKLRWALHWSHAMQVLARHPSLRTGFRLGVFWKDSHAFFLLAVTGALLASRFPPAVILTLPYLRHLRARCIAERAPLALAPYFVAYDAVETWAAASGGARAGVLVL